MRNVTFIDLRVPIQQPVEGELEGELANALAATIAYEDHRQSLPIVTRIFGCTEADLPDGQGWANEMVTLSTHAGTHMDAPWHFFPTARELPPGGSTNVRELADQMSWTAGHRQDLAGRGGVPGPDHHRGDGDTTVADFGEYTQTDDGKYELVCGPLVAAMSRAAGRRGDHAH